MENAGSKTAAGGEAAAVPSMGSDQRSTRLRGLRLDRARRLQQLCAMPELAEVEFFRRQWDPGLGRKIVAVQLHPRKRIFRGSDPREMVRELTGRRFLRSHAWGKQMLFEFSGGNWIGIHLGMTGKLRTEHPDFRPEKHDHLVLRQAKRALVFRDARLFGRVRFHHGKSLPAWWRSGAPDIGSALFDRAFLNQFLDRHARAPIKSVLLCKADLLESATGWPTRFSGVRGLRR